MLSYGYLVQVIAVINFHITVAYLSLVTSFNIQLLLDAYLSNDSHYFVLNNNFDISELLPECVFCKTCINLQKLELFEGLNSANQQKP